MSHYSTPTNNLFSTPPIQTGGENREHRSLSHSERPSMKKQRVCEALVVLNPRVPVTSNNVMTPNLVNGRTWNGDNSVAGMQLCGMFYYKRNACMGTVVDFLKTVEQDFGRFGQFASKESPKSAMWKTKLCKKWEMTVGCLYGNTCYFAHGQAELCKLGRRNASASRIVGMNVSNSFCTRNARPGIICKQRPQGERCVFNWKSLEKISGIYAD